MKLFLKDGNIFELNSNTKIELLNIDEFGSIIRSASNSVPAKHIIIGLKYKLICNNATYMGESIFDSYKSISNTIDDNSPYKVELVNWRLSDKEDKYLEMNIIEK